MYIVELEWNNFKSDIINKGFPLNYKTIKDGYEIFSSDRGVILWRTVIIGIEEIIEFESYYKQNCNKSIYDSEGRQYQRTETKPLNTTTYFTSCGDIIGSNPVIGEGTRFDWDASISENWIDDEHGAPEGTKQLIKEAEFCDSIWLKEGKIFFQNCVKESYFDLYIVCLPGGYYINNEEIRQNNTGEDLEIEHYIIKHPLMGNCSAGLSIRPETCSPEMPTYMKVKTIITIPESDNISNGCFEAMLFRSRTEIL